MDEMTKLESTVISFVVGILCPLLLFVLFWWGAALLAMSQWIIVPDLAIMLSALTGLVLGVILDIIFLGKWVSRFYHVDGRILTLIYLCCSVIAVAFFMGLPVGNLVLGTLAGVYTGRRGYHAEMDRKAFTKTVKRASFFTAIVTGAEALPIGLFALNEDWVIEWLQRVTGMPFSAVAGVPEIGLIFVLCAVLMVIQYWCTKTLARIAYGHHKSV